MNAENNSLPITCNRCFLETEIEWRTRLELLEAQNVIHHWFRGRSCVTEEYRVRRHTRFIRRMGQRNMYQKYDYTTIGEYLALNGLGINKEKVDMGHEFYFSDVKTTNCSHMLFYARRPNDYFLDNEKKPVAIDRGIKSDNRYPQLFLFKRSLEICDAEYCADTLEEAEFVEMEKSDNNLGSLIVRKISRNITCRPTPRHPNPIELRLALYSILDEFQQIRYELAVEHEFIHDEHTSLYTSPYAKTVSKYLPSTTDYPVKCLSERVQRVNNMTLSKILDAMSFTVRAVSRRSFDFNEQTMIQINVDWMPSDIGVPCNGKQNNVSFESSEYNNSGVENGNNETILTATSKLRSDIDTSERVDNDEDAMANPVIDDEETGDDEDDVTSDKVVNECQKKKIKLNTTEQNNVRQCADPMVGREFRRIAATGQSFNSKLLSYVAKASEVGTMELFMKYVENQILNRWENGDILLRRKIDGKRLYVTYDGNDLLYGDDGDVINVNDLLGRDDDHNNEDHTNVFSTNFVYQMERCRRKVWTGEDKRARVDTKYVLTEVVAVRNNYVSQLNGLTQSFGPSTMPYSYTPEQQWPYGLEGAGLSLHDTRSILQFWGYSSCASNNNSRIVRDVVRHLRTPFKSQQNFINPNVFVVSDEQNDTTEEKNIDQNDYGTDLVNRNKFTTQTTNDQEDFLQIDVESNETFSSMSPSTSLSSSQLSSSLSSSSSSSTSSKRDTVTTIKPSKPRPAVCHGCLIAESTGTRNTSNDAVFVVNHTMKTANCEYVNLTIDESLTFLDRFDRELAPLDHEIPMNSTARSVHYRRRRRLFVNTFLDPAQVKRSSLVKEFEYYYRSSILRLTDILFLNDKTEECKRMLHLHFSTDNAKQYEKQYNNTKQILLNPDASQKQDLPIDGFLVYLSAKSTRQKVTKKRNNDRYTTRCQYAHTDSSNCLTEAKSTCAYDCSDFYNDSRWHNGASLKFKPFQTIELLLCMCVTYTDGDDYHRSESNDNPQSQNQNRLLNMNFCTRALIPEQQTDVRSRTYLYVHNVPCPSNAVQLCDFKWKRLDGVTVKLYADPRVRLEDKHIYEFVCYNESTFYLICSRKDKLLPDNESKVNAIVFQRKLITDTLSEFSPLPL